MVTRKSWNDDDLINAVKNNISFAKVILALGLRPAGGNYVQVRRRIVELGLNISHFTKLGGGWNKGLSLKTKDVDIQKHLVLNNKDTLTINSSRLLKLLVRYQLKENICEKCGTTEWHGEKITFELHHMNGDHFDNRLNNLLSLCPNCHSIEDKKIRDSKKPLSRLRKPRNGQIKYCTDCGVEIPRHSKHGICFECNDKGRML